MGGRRPGGEGGGGRGRCGGRGAPRVRDEAGIFSEDNAAVAGRGGACQGNDGCCVGGGRGGGAVRRQRAAASSGAGRPAFVRREGLFLAEGADLVCFGGREWRRVHMRGGRRHIYAGGWRREQPLLLSPTTSLLSDNDDGSSSFLTLMAEGPFARGVVGRGDVLLDWTPKMPPLLALLGS